jgi:hypothetical protein
LTETKRDGLTELNAENMAEGRAQAQKEAALRQNVQKKIVSIYLAGTRHMRNS